MSNHSRTIGHWTSATGPIPWDAGGIPSGRPLPARRRPGGKLGEVQDALVDAVAADDVELERLRLRGLGLAEDEQHVVRPDRLPVAGAGGHAGGDGALPGVGEGAGAPRGGR